MSLAARQSKVLFTKALIQEQALAAQYYSADQAGTDLKSEFEPVEIQYWNIGTLSSSTRDSSGNCSRFFLVFFLLFSSPFDFFWPLTSPYERHFRWMQKTWLASPLCFWSPASTIIEHERWTVLLVLLAKYLQRALVIITSMLNRWRWCSKCKVHHTAVWMHTCLFGQFYKQVKVGGWKIGRH